MKKILNKEVLIAFIIGIILASSIAVYATMNAKQVIYKNGKNVEQALNELYTQQNGAINGYYQFTKGNNGFTIVNGEAEFNSLGIIPTSYDTIDDEYPLNVTIEKELDSTIQLNDKFEISGEISFDNRTTSNMGGIKISLYKKVVNGYEQVMEFIVRDAWAAENKMSYSSSISSNSIVNNLQWTTVNASGRYAVLCDTQNVYYYRDNTLLGNISYTNGISVDKIKIEFHGYSSSYVAPPMVLKDLYVGKPLFYKSIIGE